MSESSERRKVRKGTQSCWECKRRKVKCTFAPPRDATCDRCKRRGTLCVGQEIPQSSIKQVDRLGRVEALVEQLVKSADNSNKDSPLGHRQELQGRPRPSDSSNANSIGADSTVIISTPASPEFGVPVTVGKPDHETVELVSEHLERTEPRLRSPSPPAGRNLAPTKQAQNEELCAALLAAWPSEADLDMILSIPVEISGCLHGLICVPRSTAPGQKAPSAREMFQLPPKGSHPVLVTWKLLVLASYLQVVPPWAIPRLVHLSVSYRDIMSRAVETAHNLVNCNDELVTSIEGIECIMIESMYYNNAGNLRRSWLTMRRAMLIAQMMSLHRGRNPPSIQTPEHRSDTSPEHIWFRLVQSDRYLSLMLGLPQGAPDNDFFATENALEGCTMVERLRRIDCVAGGRILQRNEADVDNFVVTQQIDKLLQQAPMFMPPQWWLIPNLASSAVNKTEHFHETIRIIDQLTHYHLVARLHLPYLLRSLANRKYEYSKNTAMNASREVLARFVAFRTSNPIGVYCRGIDFIVFIASMTLCLAHIDAHHQRQSSVSDGDDSFFLDYLVHQRPSDRGMMERALECLEHMARASVDIIAPRIATIFRHLLFIESNAAKGSSYSTSSSASGEEGLGCNGNLSDDGNVLCIHIPCFGTINIERDDTLGSNLSMPAHIAPMSVLESPAASPGVSSSTSPFLKRQNEYIRQPLNNSDCPIRNSFGDHSGNTERQAVPSSFDPLVPPQHSTSATRDHGICDFQHDDVQIACPLIAEDLTLQGVDMAFFDSLIRGSELDVGGMDMTP